MKILIVKLSSLGDVVHTMPAVQDIRRARPDATIDWVVERGFAPLVQRCEGVARIIPADLRRWRRAMLSADTRTEWAAFKAELGQENYDAIIDLQGLTKSAFVSRAAKLASGGKRFAMANRTEGSSYEAPTRWVADEAIRIDPHVHAVARSRELCARALGYEVPAELRYGLRADASVLPPGERCVAFVHGTSRQDKCWPESNWLQLGQRLISEGYSIGLPHGNAEELDRAQRLSLRLRTHANVWPAMDLAALTDQIGACAGVIGVDSGLSHIAVALNRPHVQIYNFDTAWRTGPDTDRQRSVFGQPSPRVDAVWQAWQAVKAA